MSGCHPIRAKKARYFEDAELKARILPPPRLSRSGASGRVEDSPSSVRADDWAGAVVPAPESGTDDPANAGIRREPELPEHEDIAPELAEAVREFKPAEEGSDDDAQRLRVFQRNARTLARQVSLDPADDIGL